MSKMTESLVLDLRKRIDHGELAGKVLDPLPRAQTQEGPTCGFYALSIVMDYWKAKRLTAASAPARMRDIEVQQRKEPDDKAQTESLRRTGKRVGALDIGRSTGASPGGVFTVQQLANVAKAVRFASFRVRIATQRTPEAFIALLCRAIDAGVPPIVAFDVREGDPVPDAGGQHSHYGVIVGYFRYKTADCFVATHGHGGYYMWRTTELQQSNFALANTTLRAAKAVKVRFSGNIPKGHRATRTQWVSEESYRKFQAEAREKNLKVEVVKERSVPAVAQDLAHHILIVAP